MFRTSESGSVAPALHRRYAPRSTAQASRRAAPLKCGSNAAAFPLVC